MKINSQVQSVSPYIFPLFMLLIISGASLVFGGPPDTITLDSLGQLYESVEFDHTMHMDNFECYSCHHHTLGESGSNPFCNRCHAKPVPTDRVKCADCHDHVGGAENELPLYHIDKPQIFSALHLLCVGCHGNEGGPTGCRECHAFTQKGRQRFGVENK